MPATPALIVAANKLGATILPDDPQWHNKLQIKSSSGPLLYVVSQNRTTGEWGCSCKGWKRWRRCKHLANMLPVLRQLPSSTSTPVGRANHDRG